MKTSILTSAVLIFFLLFSVGSYAQFNTDSLSHEKAVITLNNKDVLKGDILKINDKEILLSTSYGEMTIKASDVKSIEYSDYEGKYKFPNPHATRYFFGPSAIPLGKNKGYYQNVYITSNFVNYGLSDNFSMGGGLELISAFAQYPIWFLTPKVGFQLAENVHLGGGLLVSGLADLGTVFLGYGVFTLGSIESNVSIASGYGYASSEGEGTFSKFPNVMISGMLRISNSFALISENHIIPFEGGSAYTGIHGLRIFTKRNSFSIGGLALGVLDGGIVIPYLEYAHSF